MVLIINFQY